MSDTETDTEPAGRTQTRPSAETKRPRIRRRTGRRPSKAQNVISGSVAQMEEAAKRIAHTGQRVARTGQKISDWTLRDWMRHLQRSRRWAHYLSGVVIVCAGAAAILQSGWGAAPYDGLLAAVADSPLPVQLAFWQIAWAFNGLWILTHRLIARRWIPGRSIIHSLLFGPIIQAWLTVVPEAPGKAWGGGYLLFGILAVAYGIHTYLRVGVAQGILDATFEESAKRFSKKPTTLRTAFDIATVAAAWLVSQTTPQGGYIGAGTLLVAFGVGPILAVLDGEVPIRSLRGLPLSVGRRTLTWALGVRQRLRLDEGDGRWVDEHGHHISDPEYRSDIDSWRHSPRFAASRSFAHRMGPPR